MMFYSFLTSPLFDSISESNLNPLDWKPEFLPFANYMQKVIPGQVENQAAPLSTWTGNSQLGGIEREGSQ